MVILHLLKHNLTATFYKTTKNPSCFHRRRNFLGLVKKGLIDLFPNNHLSKFPYFGQNIEKIFGLYWGISKIFSLRFAAKYDNFACDAYLGTGLISTLYSHTHTPTQNAFEET